MNCGETRTSQMLAELVLQFSTLCFCSSKREKKLKRRGVEERGVIGFPVGQLSAADP
jgi:hypothetical protein